MRPNFLMAMRGVDRVHLIQGGLGNQLFQLAYSIALRDLDNLRSYIDTTRCRSSKTYEGYVADRIFTLEGAPQQLDYVSPKFLYSYARANGEIECETGNVCFQRQFLSPRIFGYVRGFFPSWRYFYNCESNIRRAFQFKQRIPAGSEAFIKELHEGDTVAVHIRRGDYIDSKHSPVYGGICTAGYYHAAFNYILVRRPRARFYFFSDDPLWCRQKFEKFAAKVVDENTKGDSWKDMLLMSNCRHAIIANSSLSWWARWIGGYDEAICVGPSKLMNDPQIISSVDDFLPPNFTQINENGVVIKEGSRSI